MSSPRPRSRFQALPLFTLFLAAAATLAWGQDQSSKPRLVPGRDPGGVAVAIVGSGVNYTLPLLASRLARDGEGDIIGLDLEDRDNRPFDRSSLSPSGTEIASLIALEAPKARLVPVRVGDRDARAIAGALAFVASGPARIVILPAWVLSPTMVPELVKAATARRELLLIVAAGDDGASLAARADVARFAALPNVVIVGPVDASGRRLPGSNHGPPVGLAADATRVKVVTRDGMEREAAGSHIAAARVAALAARLKAPDSRLEGAALRSKLLSFAKDGVLLAPASIETDGR